MNREGGVSELTGQCHAFWESLDGGEAPGREELSRVC